MTVTADEKMCVLVPTARPGDRFNLQLEGSDRIVLTRIDSPSLPPAKVAFKMKNGYTVGVVGHKIDEQALQQALDEFP